jgi:hypothetical protein
MNEFEKYKAYLQRNSEWVAEWKKRVQEITFRKGLSSVMNDTKWIELQTAIDTLPFPPPYVCKQITDENSERIGQLEDAPWYLGDWSSFWDEGLPLFFDIDWLKVRPRNGKYRGRLVAPKILDETEEFIAILEKYSILYENENGTITIYGYK